MKKNVMKKLVIVMAVVLFAVPAAAGVTFDKRWNEAEGVMEYVLADFTGICIGEPVSLYIDAWLPARVIVRPASEFCVVAGTTKGNGPCWSDYWFNVYDPNGTWHMKANDWHNPDYPGFEYWAKVKLEPPTEYWFDITPFDKCGEGLEGVKFHMTFIPFIP